MSSADCKSFVKKKVKKVSEEDEEDEKAMRSKFPTKLII